MNQDDSLEHIKNQLKKHTETIDSHHSLTADEQKSLLEAVGFLLSLLDQKKQQIETLEKKNKVLSDHVLGMTQALENAKSDFGSEWR